MLTCSFDSTKSYPKVSALGRGSEAHAFEKILKSLLIACSLPKTLPETQKVQRKVKKFFAWVSQYFALVFICKNGKLRECLANEITPLLFVENICDFLYFNMLQGLPKLQQRPYQKGSVRALKTMLRLVKQVYGEDADHAFEALEFVEVLIQKICHLCYGQDLPKKVAANIGLRILIRELPPASLRKHWQAMLDTLFHILNTNNDSLIYQVEQECTSTVDALFAKIGLYSERLLSSVDEAEAALFPAVLDKVLQNVHQNKGSARSVATHFIELVSRRSGVSVARILSSV